MKKRNIQNFEKALSFSVMTAKKWKESREISKQKPIRTKMEGKRGNKKKKTRTRCIKCTPSAYCKFGDALRNEAISTEEFAKKIWAIVLKED